MTINVLYSSEVMSLLRTLKKTPEKTIIGNFKILFGQCNSAFNQSRTYERARTLSLELLSCMGRCTITGMLSASGNQFKDWSASYRLFKGERMKLDELFRSIRKQVVHLNGPQQPIYAHMDGTLLRKRGKKIHGTGWMRDPLSPPFASNFVWGQRFIQISLSLLENSIFCPSRAIPVDFVHCPPVQKPSKMATQQEIAVYRERQKKEKMSAVGIKRIIHLRNNLDDDGYTNTRLVLSVDGSYTNETVLKQLPANVDLIGRIRKAAKLYQLPEPSKGQRGRKRYYGSELPTPEQIRQDPIIPYQPVEAWAAGKMRVFDVKLVKNVRWRNSKDRNLMLIIIRPVSYRLTKKSRLLYRNPAYLISTDQNTDIRLLLQAYIRRWEIEVGFRDQKTLIRCSKSSCMYISLLWYDITSIAYNESESKYKTSRAKMV